MSEKQQAPDVYGRNVPASEDTGAPDIRQDVDKAIEQGTAEQIDEIRKKEIEERPASGGMGREETPRGEESPGEWHRPEQEDKRDLD